MLETIKRHPYIIGAAVLVFALLFLMRKGGGSDKLALAELRAKSHAAHEHEVTTRGLSAQQVAATKYVTKTRADLMRDPTIMAHLEAMANIDAGNRVVLANIAKDLNLQIEGSRSQTARDSQLFSIFSSGLSSFGNQVGGSAGGFVSDALGSLGDLFDF